MVGWDDRTPRQTRTHLCQRAVSVVLSLMGRRNANRWDGFLWREQPPIPPRYADDCTPEDTLTVTLYLPLKAVYFGQICAGTKREEYRLITPHWSKRLEAGTMI